MDDSSVAAISEGSARRLAVDDLCKREMSQQASADTTMPGYERR